MSCGFPGRYDPIGVFITQSGDDEEHPAVTHSNDESAFLVIDESDVDLFQTSRILERYDGFPKIDAVLAKI
jgi:hypothetical protein